MDKLLNRWESLEAREQLIASVGGLVFVLAALFFFGVMPLLNWQDQERQRLGQVQSELNEVKKLAAQVKVVLENAKKKPVKTKGLSVLIDNSLRKHELTMRGFQPGNKNDARLRLDNAAYSSLTQWLYDLEYSHNVTIIDLSLTPANTSGRLMVSLRVNKQ